MNLKIGRNDLCPCGSGKKYKACCGKSEQGVSSRSGRAQIPAMMEQAIYLGRIGLLKEAEDLYRDILALNANDADALNNLGMIAVQSGRLEEACDCFRRAVKIKPEHAVAWLNLGSALQDLRNNAEAMQAFRKCIKLKPDFQEAHNNLGSLLQQEMRLIEAASALKKALQLKPDLVEAICNLGAVHKDLGELEQAVACFRRAIDLQPDDGPSYNNLLFALNYAPGLSAQEIYEEHARFGRRFPEQARPAKRSLEGRKLRIGYVSGDFRYHTVFYFLEPVLAHHDREQVEIFCYCNNAADDHTARLQSLSDGWRDIRYLNARQTAQQIRDDGIDILIDLAGHTAHNRLDVFAERAAPVQMTWLGYFNTTGMHAVDYLVSDPVSSPLDDRQRFAETVLRMPQVRLCYRAPDYAPEPSTPPAMRNGYITFGSFNLLTKVNDDVIALWSRILHAVPDSRLLLKSRNFNEPAMQTRIAEQFRRHGIAPERLMLRTHTPHAEMLAEYADMDIALDPFPFNGGLTTCEALWQGVPVLTLRGEALIERQSASFLGTLGMEDWIAESKDDYLERAQRHAADVVALTALRTGLRAKMLASPVCDARRFAGDFEALLLSAWHST
jgi:predicted O-linked N-acetylglucosamine transferase (SPINDLY family)